MKLLKFLKPFTRKKVLADRESIEEVVSYYTQGLPVSSISSKFMWSKDTVKKWIDNHVCENSLSTGLVIESDDDEPSLSKRQKIEEMYLSNNERVSENIINVDCYREQNWLQKFKENCITIL